MKSNRLVIVDGIRTPFCKLGTDLAQLGADELGRIAVNALLGLLLLGPAVALTPLLWQRVTSLPQQVLETSDAPEPSR